MNDDAFRELLRSPLDDLPEPGSRRTPSLILGGALAGVALTAALLWSLGGFDEEEPPPTLAPATTVTTAPAPAPQPAAFETLWLHQDGDVIYATVAELGAPGEVDVDIGSANWRLELDGGESIEAAAEQLDPRAPGVYTAAFPAAGVDVEDVTGLSGVPLAGTTEATSTAELEGVRFPLPLPPPEPALAVGDSTLVVDDAVLHGAGGEIGWHLEGPAGERATLVVAADYIRTGTARRDAIRTEFQIPGVPLQLGQDADEPARSGTIDLFHLDDPEEPTFRTRFWGDPDEEFDVEVVTVTWTLTVYRYGGEEIRVPPPPAR